MANEVPPNRIFFNDGTGKFTERVGALPSTPPLESREVVAFDADGDGDLDLVFFNITCNACNTRVKDSQVRLLFNDGEGNFTDVTEGRMPKNEFSSWAGEAVDLDGDGHIDLLVSAIQVPGFANGALRPRAYRNNGKGFFTDFTDQVLPLETVGRSWDFTLGDVNGDGKTDLFIGGWKTQARLLFGSVTPVLGVRQGPRRKDGKTGAAESRFELAKGVFIVNYERRSWRDLSGRRLPALISR